MSFFRIRKVLQLRVCNHEKPLANPCTARKGEPFYRRGRKLGGLYYTKSPRLFIGRLFAKKGVFLLSVGLCYGSLRAPPSGLLTLFNWNFCLLFFIVDTIVFQPLLVLKIRVPEDRLRNCFKKVCVWFWCTLGICKTRMRVLTYGLGHSQETVTNTWIPDSSSLSWAYMLALPPCSGTESLPRGNESSLPLCTN